MKYERPNIILLKADLVLLSNSRPEATSIGSPSVNDNAKEYSIWDNETIDYEI